jgi:hypothetical protein
MSLLWEFTGIRGSPSKLTRRVLQSSPNCAPSYWGVCVCVYWGVCVRRVSQNCARAQSALHRLLKD